MKEVVTLWKKNKFLALLLMVVSLLWMVLSAIPATSAATPTITLTPTSQTPGGSVTVTGTGFGAIVAVGIGFGAETNATNENMVISGPFDVANGPYVAFSSYAPIKPGTFTMSVNVTSTLFVRCDTDLGNGSLSDPLSIFINGTLNYATGQRTRFTKSPVSSTTYYLHLVNYTRYQYNVTPAANITTDASGAFTASITVPAVANRDYNVTAIDANGNRATSNLSVGATATYDWPMFRHNAQHTGYSASPAPSTNQTLWNYTTGGMVDSSPSVANGVVYVGSGDNNVYALNAASGTPIWNYTTGGKVYSSPAVANSKVYVSSADSKIYCLDAATGALIWNYTTGNGAASSPVVANGRVYVGSDDDKVYCLGDVTGVLLWSYTTGGNVYSSPAVADGRVYVGSSDNKVYCLNAAVGSLVWNYTTGNQVTSSPAVANGIVYVGSHDKKLYALDASNGASVWNFTTGSWIYSSSPAVADGKVYIGSNDNNMYCLNAATGALMWNYTAGSWVCSSPAVADGKVYVGSSDNKVYCLNAASGAFIWSYTTGKLVWPSPAIANGVVYVGSEDGKIYAFSASPPISASMWSKTYGGAGNDIGWGDMFQTSDGGYVISGDTESFGAGGKDYWLIKIDAAGNVLWNKTYGGNGTESQYFMCQTSDGGYALVGGTNSFGGGGNDYWLVKTDASGNMQWNKTYGGTENENDVTIIQTSDGGYAIGGGTYSFGAGGNDVWLIKTDTAGNMQWNKTYGGTGNDFADSLVATSDGGYALGGATTSFGAGSDDFWLIKTDASGNMQWNKTYGGTGIDLSMYLIRTLDGGYAMTGYTTSFSGVVEAYLVKTDASGNMQWNKTYGGNAIDIGVHVLQTAEGGYTIIGYTRSFGAGGEDVWLIRTDAAGNTLWNKTYGGTGHDQGWSLIQTSDGGYAMAGGTYSFGAGGQDFYFVKTDASGVVPESLTFMVIMLLSSVAALIGTRYFRKPPRFAK